MTTSTVTLAIEPLLVDRETAAAMLRGMSVSTFETLARTEPLLKPRIVSGRLVGWPVANLREWANTRPVSDQLPPENCHLGRSGRKARNSGGAQA